MLLTSIRRVALPPRPTLTAWRLQRLRSLSTSAESTAARWSRKLVSKWEHATHGEKRIVFASGGVTVAAIWLLWASAPGDRDPIDPRDASALSKVPFGKLFAGWIAFAFCSSPTWVDMSEALYAVVSKIPIMSSIAHSFVMGTFFTQFLGGETTEECTPKIRALRKESIGTLLGYNIEAELDGSRKDPNLIRAQTEEVLASIESQARLAREFYPDTNTTSGDNRCWVRIKVTGLIPCPTALLHGSNSILEARKAKGLDTDVPYPGLPHDGDWEAAVNGVTPVDREQLLNLYGNLDRIMRKARENNIRVVIDAEQTWYQPVIDSLTDRFMQTYNTLDGPATCIASFQAYLRRYPQLLNQQILRADKKGYKLLFKQVRGAYIKTEGERWAREGRHGPGPVWASKKETDASFNYGIEKALSVIRSQIEETGSSRLGAVFATHNSYSVDFGIQLLEEYGMAKRKTPDGKLIVPNEVAGSISFGQIYGIPLPPLLECYSDANNLKE